MNFNQYRYWILTELSRLQRLVITIDILIEKEIEKVEKDISAEGKIESNLLDEMLSQGAYSGENIKEFDSSIIEIIKKEHYEELSKLFYGSIWSALFLKTYSFSEFALSEICDYHSKNSRIKISPTDLKGHGIHRSKLYLKKVAEVMFPDQTPEWRKITIYNLIRNIYSHNGGYIDDKKKQKEVIEFAHSNHSISIEDDNYILLSKQFLFDVQHNFVRFFGKLLEELQTI